MNPEPTATPAPAPTANESGLSLETEPLLFFNPTLAGLAVAGQHPAVRRPLIPSDEEPAVWAEVAE